MNLGALGNDQHSGASRSPQFVAGQAQQRHRRSVQFEGDLPGGLNGVHMEGDSGFSAELGDLRDRKDQPRFLIHPLDGDQLSPPSTKLFLARERQLTFR